MTSSRFDEHRVALYEEVDAEFAEPLRVFPLKNGQTIADQPPIEIEAVLRTEDRTSLQPDGGNNSNWNIKLAAGKAAIAIDRARYPAIALHKGCRVCALARPGLPMFEVQYVDLRSHRRLYATLGEVAAGKTGNA
ncbi:hypothetical protein [Ochrobactrum sp. S1502_03]|uniref:hypothetical protein n=1 Tax=Ochrobactrum sp. S1502_03 TaxID=3108451 RepID=UPI0037C72C1F